MAAWEEHKKVHGYSEDQKPAWVGTGEDAAVAIEAEESAKVAKVAEVAEVAE